MKQLLKLSVVAALSLAAATVVKAENALQLDIVGGVYDPIHKDVVSAADVFQLAAILNPANGSAPASNDTFYIAVSLIPKTTTAFAGGSFDFAGTTVNVTADMTSGTPAGLSPHGQFPNFYREFAFTFDLSNAGKVDLYNTEDSPGGPTFNTSGAAFAKLFNVDKSGLTGDVELHFDLYNKALNRRGALVVDKNAPFSHDASTIPEPSGFVLTAAGMALFGVIRRKRS